RRFVLIAIDDRTDEFMVRAALDVAGQAVLVIDSQGRVLAFNKPAQALFASVAERTDASNLLRLAGMPPRWWEPGLSGRRKMQIGLGPRIYQATRSASPPRGDDEQISVVAFLPVARSASGERAAQPGGQAVNGALPAASDSSRVPP